MKIIFPTEQYKKLRTYIENIKYEISGLGKIRVVDGDFVVEDIRIFRQTVTPSETKIDRRALARFYDEIMQAEGDLSAWKLWWHSHATFDAFFSPTDAQTIFDFDNETPTDNWMVSVVSNHAGDIKTRLDIFSPMHTTVSDIAYKIDFEDQVLREQILDEITEKVTIQATPPTPPRRPAERRFGWGKTPGSSLTSTIIEPEIIIGDPEGKSLIEIINEESRKPYKHRRKN